MHVYSVWEILFCFERSRLVVYQRSLNTYYWLYLYVIVIIIKKSEIYICLQNTQKWMCRLCTEKQTCSCFRIEYVSQLVGESKGDRTPVLIGPM